MEGETPEDPTLFPARPGEKLRAAREAQGLDIAEIAARTRIPQRHLEAVESGSYAGLPSTTYALGFAKAYARTVGLDEVAIAREVRAELGSYERVSTPAPEYPLDEPARVAPRGLMWFGVIVAILIVAGVGLWYGTDLFRDRFGNGDGGLVQADPSPTPSAAPAPSPSPTVPTIEHVTLVALDAVWIRVTDATGKKLFEKELAQGERYEVPDDADHPHVRTGRPEKLQVLVNGSEVPPLGTGEKAIDVEVSAAALRSRGQPAPAATDTPAAATADAPATRQRRLGPRAADSIDRGGAAVPEAAGGNSSNP